MKPRMSRICTVTAAVALGIFAVANAASAENALSSMRVEAREPLRATLMPTVSVDADASTFATRMRVADVAPIEVTLMPTVYVTAQAPRERSAALLPAVRVVAQREPAGEAVRVADREGLPDLADAVRNANRQDLVSRVRSMPQ